MNVLLIGSGAREHAIALKLRQSALLDRLIVAPGNAGIEALTEVAPLAPPKAGGSFRAYFEAVLEFVRRRKIDFVVVGAEDPLAGDSEGGLVDYLQREGVPCFGPSAAAARIESSKGFAKQLMARHGVPMSTSASFDDFSAARDYIESRTGDVVVKADGLAAGKGAIVTDSHKEAIRVIRELILDGALGAARAVGGNRGPAGRT